MFVLDEANRLTYVTDSLAGWLGADPETLTDTRLTRYVSEAAPLQRTLRDIRSTAERATRHCECALTTPHGTVHVEIEFVSSSGESADVHGVVQGEATDRARSELVTARDRFGHLFGLIQDSVVELEIVEMEPIVRSVNPAFEEVFGYDAETVVGNSLNEFIVPNSRDYEAVRFDQRSAEGEANFAFVTRQTDQGLREFLYRGVPYNRGDGGQYAFAIYSDITEQKRAQEQLRVLQRIMRHNLRNKLTVLQGTASKIRDLANDPEIVSAAELALQSTETLHAVSQKAQIAADILDSPRNGTVDAAAQARAVVERFRSEYPEATIETDLPGALSTAVGPELERALENLVENALKHGCSSPTVRVTGQREDDEVILTVTDDGPGIPATERIAIFGDEETTQLKHGTSLGLWLVKWIIESAGGRLGYERLDGSTAVTLWLPTPTDAPQTLADD